MFDALIVDDSLSARKILARRLQKLGLSTLEASDGLDAIERLKNNKCRFVFTDLDMPGMDGLGLLNEIQQQQLTNAKCVVVSSRSRDEVWKKISNAGASEFIQKPVSDELLEAAITS